MKRWLGIDWGKARIGVALSDPLGMTAQPLTVLKSVGIQKDIAALGELVREYEVSQVVIGLPFNMDGSESVQSKNVREFTNKLIKRLGVPVFYVDERFTSKQAEKAMIEGGARRDKRREKIDQVAAALLLQSALGGAHLIPADAPE